MTNSPRYGDRGPFLTRGELRSASCFVLGRQIREKVRGQARHTDRRQIRLAAITGRRNSKTESRWRVHNRGEAPQDSSRPRFKSPSLRRRGTCRFAWTRRRRDNRLPALSRRAVRPRTMDLGSVRLRFNLYQKARVNRLFFMNVPSRLSENRLNPPPERAGARFVRGVKLRAQTEARIRLDVATESPQRPTG